MKLESFILPEHYWVPNNPRLPVLLYRSAITAADCESMAKAFEAAFEENGWPPQWRDGIYDCHHCTIRRRMRRSVSRPEALP
jgi:uncharacterized protein YjlB